MTIWVVLGWNDYYPNWDNAVGYFLKKEDAEKCYDEKMLCRDFDNYEYFSVEVN